jgi:hypothetical protein
MGGMGCLKHNPDAPIQLQHHGDRENRAFSISNSSNPSLEDVVGSSPLKIDTLSKENSTGFVIGNRTITKPAANTSTSTGGRDVDLNTQFTAPIAPQTPSEETQSLSSWPGCPAEGGM